MANQIASLIQAKETARPQGGAYGVGQYLELECIRTDGGTQARDGLNDATVRDYAETWQTLSSRQNGFLEMPPIVVYHDGTHYWLADGFHRVAAYQQFLDGGSASASPRAIRAEVRQGTQRDAILFACGANDTHGLRRTQADKRRAIERLLRDDEWRQWSDSEIARRCNVSHPTVATVRRELYPENLQDSRTVERNGTTYQQKPPAQRTHELQRPDPPLPPDMVARAKTVGLNVWINTLSGGGYQTGEATGATNYQTFPSLEALSDFIASREGGPRWATLTMAHPTAHLWTQRGPKEYHAACGIKAYHDLEDRPDAGHCSSCVRATWAQSQTTPAPAQPTIAEHPPAAPDLHDILFRLSAHGYDRVGGTRQRGSTTLYTFRDRASDMDEESAGVLELAEGELPLWLNELDASAAYTQQRNERYQQQRDRAAALGYDLRRDGVQFALTPAGQTAPAMPGTLDQLSKVLDGYERSAAKTAAAAEPTYTIEQLDACLPKGYSDLGYFWVTATPPTLGHIDGWRGDVHTIAQAIAAAAAREKVKAEPTNWNKVAELSYKLGAATDRNAAQDIWLAIGPLLEPQGVQQVVSSWRPDEVQAFAAEADKALGTLDVYGYTQVATFMRQTYEMLLDKAPPPAFLFTSRQKEAKPAPEQLTLGASPLDPIRAELEAIEAWMDRDTAIRGAIHEKLSELAALRTRLEALVDAPDVFDDDYEELSAMIGEAEATIKGWLEETKD